MAKQLAQAALTMALAAATLPGQYNYQYVTAGSGGVSLNNLVTEDASNPTLFVASSTSACGAGFALAAATSGSAFPLASGAGTVQTGVADSTAITAGHILGGGSPGGTVHDLGTNSRASVGSAQCVVGVALAGASAGSTVSLLYDGPGSYGGGPGSANLTVPEAAP